MTAPHARLHANMFDKVWLKQVAHKPCCMPYSTFQSQPQKSMSHSKTRRKE
jgi:hypothetical protein